MVALDTYRYVLKELDKFESPTFNVDDFNYFFNSAIDAYITKNFEQGDIFEKELDDISVIVRDGYSATRASDHTLFSKPDDYRHMLYGSATVEVNSDYRKWKRGDSVTFVLKRQRTNRRGYQEENAYEQPSEEYSQYRVSNEYIKVLVGPNFDPLSLIMMYIAKPNVVYLNPNSGADFNNPANNSVIQFPDYVAKEIIKWCARMFLENIESPRYRSAVSEQQIRQE